MIEDTATPAPSEPVAGPVQRKLGQAAEARWYCLDREGLAMLCKDEADALAEAAENDKCWPGRAPHRAVLLGDVAAERDCRICRHFRGTQHCHSVLRCVDGSSYQRGGVVQLWEAEPVDAGF